MPNAQLRVYYSKASTGLDWPVSWDDFYVDIAGEQILAGDEITINPVLISDEIAPGSSRTIAIPWYPPNPEIFGNDEQHFCLLARIESFNDPISFTEGIETNVKTIKNNNIAWRNLSIFNNDPDNVLGPVTVYLSCKKVEDRKIRVHVPNNSLNRDAVEIGQIFMKMDKEVEMQWIAQGEKGEDFLIDKKGIISVEGNDFVIDKIPEGSCGQKLHVFFNPKYRCREASFDVIEFDGNDNVIGGERFQYIPDNSKYKVNCAESAIVEHFVSTKTDGTNGFIIYPNPVMNELNIANYDNGNTIYAYSLYDYKGTQLISVEHNRTDSMSLNTSDLKPGIYLVKISYLDEIDGSYKIATKPFYKY